MKGCAHGTGHSHTRVDAPKVIPQNPVIPSEVESLP